MKILFDEDTPYPLNRHLLGHEITTVPKMGWAGIKNGTLLGLVEEEGFEVFLTCDQNLEYQQTLSRRPFAIIVFKVSNKRMETLLPLVPQLLALLSTAQPGQTYHIENKISESE